MGDQIPIIREVYQNYTPPINVASIIRLLLDDVTSTHLAGLGEIVLTSSSGLPRKERRGRAKAGIQLKSVLGRYHQHWKGQPAWIEIFVDNTLQSMPRLLMKTRLFQYMVLSQVLYHEIGHHIQYFGNFQLRDQERFAEKWEGKLTRVFVRKRYWYLQPIILILRVGVKIGRLLRVARKRIQNNCLDEKHDSSVPAGTHLYPLHTSLYGSDSARYTMSKDEVQHSPIDDE